MSQIIEYQDPVIAFPLRDHFKVRNALRPLTSEMLRLPTLGSMLSVWFKGYQADIEKVKSLASENPKLELLAKGLFLALPTCKDYCLFIGTENLEQAGLSADWSDISAWVVPQLLLVQAPHFSDLKADWDDSLYSSLFSELEGVKQFHLFAVLKRYGGIDTKLFERLKIPNANLLIREVLGKAWYESHLSSTWLNPTELSPDSQSLTLFESPSLMEVVGFAAQQLIGVLSDAPARQSENFTQFSREVELFIRFEKNKYQGPQAAPSSETLELRQEVFESRWFYWMEESLSKSQRRKKKRDYLQDFYPFPSESTSAKWANTEIFSRFAQKLISVSLPTDPRFGCYVEEIPSKQFAVACSDKSADFEVIPDFMHAGVRFSTEYPKDNLDLALNHAAMMENATGVPLNAKALMLPCFDFNETFEWTQKSLSEGLDAMQLLERLVQLEIQNSSSK